MLRLTVTQKLNPVAFTARVDKHKQKYARVINDVMRMSCRLTKYAQLAVTHPHTMYNRYIKQTNKRRVAHINTQPITITDK